MYYRLRHTPGELRMRAYVVVTGSSKLQVAHRDRGRLFSHSHQPTRHLEIGGPERSSAAPWPSRPGLGIRNPQSPRSIENLSSWFSIRREFGLRIWCILSMAPIHRYSRSYLFSDLELTLLSLIGLLYASLVSLSQSFGTRSICFQHSASGSLIYSTGKRIY